MCPSAVALFGLSRNASWNRLKLGRSGSFSRAYGKGIVPQGENGSQPGDGEHQERGLDNDPLVLAEDSPVDDPLD